MAVGGPRRNPYGAPSFFGYDDQFGAPPVQPPQSPFLGFQDVAGVGSAAGVGGDNPIDYQPQLIEALPTDTSQQEAPAPEDSGGMFGGSDTSDYSDEAVKRRMALAQKMIEQGQDDSPIQSPWQAAARAVQQIGGAWMQKKAEQQASDHAKAQRETMKKALGGGGDLEAMADQLIASNDPDMVDKGLEIKQQLVMARMKKGDKSQAPDVKTIIDGDREYSGVWNPETGKYEPIGEAGPRFNPRTGRGGGRNNGGQFDDADAIGGDPSKPVAGPFSQETAEALAWRALKGDPGAFANLSRANGGAQLKQIYETAVRLGKAQGMSPQQIGERLALAKGEYGGFAQSQRTAGQSGARIRIAADAANKMADIALDQSKKVPRTQFVPLNRMLLAIRSGTGDKNVSAFYAATNSFVQAYARAVTPVGAPTDAKMKHAWDMLNQAQTQEQYEAVITILKSEMQAEISATADTQEGLSEDFGRHDDGNRGARDQAPQSTGPKLPQGVAPKEQRKVGTTVNKGGVDYVWDGQHWIPKR